MFDVGFSEMVVIAIVALVVIGPEKLPKVARTLGHLVGRMQRYVGDIKADINREMELEELRKLKDEFQRSALSAEQSIRGEIDRTQDELRTMHVGLDSPNELATFGKEGQKGRIVDSSQVAGGQR